MIDCTNCREEVTTLVDVKTDQGIENWCDRCAENSAGPCSVCGQSIDRNDVYEITKGRWASSVTVCRDDLVSWSARESTPSLPGATAKVKL